MSQTLDCKNCDLKDCQIKLLLEKINLYEELLNTSQLLDRFDQSIQRTNTECQTFISGNMLESESEISSKIDSIPSESESEISSKIDSIPSDSTISLLAIPTENHSVNSISSQEISVELSAPTSDPPMEMAGEPFKNFSADKLIQELTFTHDFGNRKSLYFGDQSYSYSGVQHNPNKLDPSSYLAKVCSYLDIVLPEYKHNSVMINYYENGANFIPQHSDSECSIEEFSDIITVSLGATRTLRISDATSGQTVRDVVLTHGSLSSMSKASQSKYKHELLPDNTCFLPRVSITFRLMKCGANSKLDNVACGYSDNDASCGFVDFKPRSLPTLWKTKAHQPANVNPPNQIPEPNPVKTQRALYISSSMFRGLDTDKLSSKSMIAQKLFYPGANADIMLTKLKADISKVVEIPNVIFIMCGTNNVDSIYYGSKEVSYAIDGISKLIRYVKSKFPSAKVNVVNILPRSTAGKNDVVDELNLLVESKICRTIGVNFMSTKHLFNFRDGKRINSYFEPPTGRIIDNCHMNKDGITRFGKYMKYWTYRLLRN